MSVEEGTKEMKVGEETKGVPGDEQIKDLKAAALDNNGGKTDDDDELDQKIIKQIEFYFGDANLPRDKFMLEQVKLDDGWIPMSTMLKFQRLARLSSDPNVIVNAVKSSQLVEVDTAGSEPKLRRSPEMPLPELNAERRKSIISRTIYCKKFPLDADMDAVMKVINAHGSPENILMRKYKDKLTQKYMFKGSIFVTFKTSEEAKAFYEKEDVKVGDLVLEKLWQVDYQEKKKKEIEEKDKARGKTKNGNADKEKENVSSREFKKGATIHLKGNFEGFVREDILKALEEKAVEPAYISFAKGDKEAFVRLAEENSAKAAVEKMTEDFTVNDSKMEMRILEGEEEEEYLKKASEDKKKRLQYCKNSRNAKQQGGGRRFSGKRRGGRRNNDPPSKKAK